MAKQKPLGMRIGESVFCAGYLLFALVAGIVFVMAGWGAHPAYAGACAAMTFLLGCGDAFHLVPRILGNVHGETDDPEEQRRRAFWLGLGNLVSSITMTGFYILLFDAMTLMPGVEGQVHAGQSVARTVLVMLAAVRVALCLFPQNRWFSREGDRTWGIRRNVPFVAMGAITVLYLVVWYQEWMLAGLVTLSFACYMGVVLYARDKPMMGMLMIPKTICYICVIAIMLGRL